MNLKINVDGYDIYIKKGSKPTIFYSPIADKIFATEAFIKSTTSSELRATVCHELGHRKRRYRRFIYPLPMFLFAISMFIGYFRYFYINIILIFIGIYFLRQDEFFADEFSIFDKKNNADDLISAIHKVKEESNILYDIHSYITHPTINKRIKNLKKQLKKKLGLD